MTDHRTTVRAAIVRVAPELDPDTLSDDTPFREDAGLDSMDFLNVLAAIAEVTGVEVPERDYPSVTTIGTLAAYLDERAGVIGDSRGMAGS
jgi:acyl carrier protein